MNYCLPRLWGPSLQPGVKSSLCSESTVGKAGARVCFLLIMAAWSLHSEVSVLPYHEKILKENASRLLKYSASHTFAHFFRTYCWFFLLTTNTLVVT